MSASDREHYRRILEARHHDPFAWLGRHPLDQRTIVRSFVPDTAALEIETVDGYSPMRRLDGSDVFVWQGHDSMLPPRYRLRRTLGDGHVEQFHDPYCFPTQIGDLDLHLYGEGRHWHIYRILGGHNVVVDGVAGAFFATWAPSAERVSVVGDFNGWDGRRHPMRVRGASGVWELFVPNVQAGACYKFEVRHRDSGSVSIKSDPYEIGRAHV